ncbi:MAG TPA: cytochrome c [Chitinophagaceae bacterium]|jgi:nitric oxide reductase subunit C|nr:cytochrome c [Chitinophagaceae bacterium]
MKILIFLVLFISYAVYSAVVYTRGTKSNIKLTNTEREQVDRGKSLFQQYNCTSCHQLYGLGGYLGPELTTAYSDTYRGPLYMKAFLQNGGVRMPNFHFSEKDIDALIGFLKYVDETAITYKHK